MINHVQRILLVHNEVQSYETNTIGFDYIIISSHQFFGHVFKMSAKWTTSYTCQKEFSNTFEVLSNTIIYLFCGYTVSWEYKVSITTYVNSKTYIKNKKNHKAIARNIYSQTL